MTFMRSTSLPPPPTPPKLHQNLNNFNHLNNSHEKWKEMNPISITKGVEVGGGWCRWVWAGVGGWGRIEGGRVTVTWHFQSHVMLTSPLTRVSFVSNPLARLKYKSSSTAATYRAGLPSSMQMNANVCKWMQIMQIRPDFLQIMQIRRFPAANGKTHKNDLRIEKKTTKTKKETHNQEATAVYANEAKRPSP